MKLDHHCFQVSKLREDQKKRSSPKIQEFFFPESRENQKKVQGTDVDQCQIIGGNADVDHSQIIWGDAVKLLRGYISPIPPRVRHPCAWNLERNAT